jgi:hypothetical protein
MLSATRVWQDCELQIELKSLLAKLSTPEMIIPASAEAPCLEVGLRITHTISTVYVRMSDP